MGEKIRNFTFEDFLKRALVVGALSLFIIFLVMPLIMVFTKAFFNKEGVYVGFDQFAGYLTTPNMVQSLKNTLYISIISTIISVSIAFGFAFCLSRKNVYLKKLVRTCAMLPMFAPTMLFGMALIYLFGNKGIFTQMGFVIPLYGKTGIIMAESIYCFPVALMILEVAFSSADNRLYEAADTMGTSDLRKMLTITLPSVKYGLINAIFVCFTYSFTDFGAPCVVGGNYNVLATDIYKQVIGQQNFNMGAVVGIFMMFPTVISFIVDRMTNAKQVGSISSKSVPYVIKPHKTSDRISSVFCYGVAAFIILFFAISLYGSLITSWPYNLKLTLKHYDFSTVGAGSGIQALSFSIKVAAIVAIVGTFVAFSVAYIIEKFNILPKLRRLLYFLAITPNAVPGTVLGLAFILFFNPKMLPIPFTDYSIDNVFCSLYGTMGIIVVANIIHYFSVPFVTASTGLKKLDKEFEVVSDSMGIPFYKTFFKITMPISLGTLLEMAVYYFMNSMITVSAVIFLYTPMTKLASIVILNVKDAGDDAEAAALCMVIVLINVVVRLIYEILHKKLEGKHRVVH